MEKGRAKGEKKEKHSFRQILSNNFYMIGIAYRACPSRVIWPFLMRLITQFRDIFIAVVFMGQITKYIEEGAAFRQALPFLIFSVIAMVIMNSLRMYYWYINEPVGNQKLYEQLHVRMFEKAADVELSCYENPDFFNKYMKATAQIKTRAHSVLWAVPVLLAELLGTAYLLYRTMKIDRLTILFAIVPLISTYLLGTRVNRVTYDLYQENMEAERTKDYVKRSVYQVEYAKELRLSNGFTLLKDYFTGAVDKVVGNTKKYGLRIALLNCLTDSMNQVFVLVGSVLYASVKLLYFKSITVSDYIVLVNAIILMFGSMRHSASCVAKIQENSLYIQNIRDFMEYEPEISESAKGRSVDKESLELRAEGVSYNYLGQKEPVLRDINLSIKKGEKIALVGENGAGKTTLVKLLMRLYEVSEGSITLGKTDIREFAPEAYRKYFGAVFQDYQLLATTIGENVMMDLVKDSDEPEILDALDKSGFTEKLAELKDGTKTYLGREFRKDGANLSGGEGQKVAIARVFPKDCKMVILDEPSSALDPISEYNVNHSMLTAAKDKTVVFISHRLSTTKLADRIVMLEKGRIIEEGSHEELMALGGKYAEMFTMQAEKYQGA